MVRKRNKKIFRDLSEVEKTVNRKIMFIDFFYISSVSGSTNVTSKKCGPSKNLENFFSPFPKRRKNEKSHLVQSPGLDSVVKLVKNLGSILGITDNFFSFVENPSKKNLDKRLDNINKIYP